MRFVGEVGFVIITGLCLASIIVLAVCGKRTGKGLLMSFLVLSLISAVGFYLLRLIRTWDLSTDMVVQITMTASLALQLLRWAAWALLFAYVLTLGSIDHTKQGDVGKL